MNAIEIATAAVAKATAAIYTKVEAVEAEIKTHYRTLDVGYSVDGKGRAIEIINDAFPAIFDAEPSAEMETEAYVILRTFTDANGITRLCPDLE